MIDVQKNQPIYKIPIYRVGIKELKIPIYISEKNGGQQHSVANVDVFVDLDSNSKGTHMSRLAIGVQKFLNHQLNSNLLKEITEYIKNKCNAKIGQVIYKFPYFLKKIAPISKEPGLVHCDVEFNYTINTNKDKFQISVTSLSTSLCPCSKEISKNGAHNQRSKIKIICEPKDNNFIWIEDLINISELCSSCEIYSVLKRTDEKHVTEKAYDNPVFVEDLVRCLYQKLNHLPLNNFTVEVTNEESIHTHDAYAQISKMEECQ